MDGEEKYLRENAIMGYDHNSFVDVLNLSILLYRVLEVKHTGMHQHYNRNMALL